MADVEYPLPEWYINYLSEFGFWECDEDTLFVTRDDALAGLQGYL